MFKNCYLIKFETYSGTVEEEKNNTFYMDCTVIIHQRDRSVMLTIILINTRMYKYFHFDKMSSLCES